LVVPVRETILTEIPEVLIRRAIGLILGLRGRNVTREEVDPARMSNLLGSVEGLLVGD